MTTLHSLTCVSFRLHDSFTDCFVLLTLDCALLTCPTLPVLRDGNLLIPVPVLLENYRDSLGIAVNEGCLEQETLCDL